MKAFVLTMRHSGLRIGDTIALKRERVKGNKLFLYTQGTGTPVYVPLPPAAVAALEKVNGDGEHFFTSGKAKPRAGRLRRGSGSSWRPVTPFISSTSGCLRRILRWSVSPNGCVPRRRRADYGLFPRLRRERPGSDDDSLVRAACHGAAEIADVAWRDRPCVLLALEEHFETDEGVDLKDADTVDAAVSGSASNGDLLKTGFAQ
jgi:integrase